MRVKDRCRIVVRTVGEKDKQKFYNHGLLVVRRLSVQAFLEFFDRKEIDGIGDGSLAVCRCADAVGCRDESHKIEVP